MQVRGLVLFAELAVRILEFQLFVQAADSD